MGPRCLAVCAGLQILGTSFVGPDGVQADGLGLVDCATRRGSGPRAVGEIVVEPVAGLGLPALSGYENHAGVTSVGPGASPAGQVRYGVGNGDGSGTDGVWAGRVFGTYLHGPVLARNPALADLLLGWAVGPLASLDDHEEQDLRAERLAASGYASRRRRAGPPVEPGRRPAMTSTALLTDRYELTMLDAALQAGTADLTSTFEVFTRRLPHGRRAGVFAGLARLLDALEAFCFGPEELEWLAGAGVVRPSTLDWLARFSFAGDVHAYAEGELYTDGSPVLSVEAPFGQAVLLETIVLSILNHDSSVAAAASLIAQAAAGRPVIEMGSRRTDCRRRGRGGPRRLPGWVRLHLQSRGRSPLWGADRRNGGARLHPVVRRRTSRLRGPGCRVRPRHHLPGGHLRRGGWDPAGGRRSRSGTPGDPGGFRGPRGDGPPGPRAPRRARGRARRKSLSRATWTTGPSGPWARHPSTGTGSGPAS